jgi:hypothetical protein
MPKRKKKKALPKLRHGWAINPKTRVEPSIKAYKRSAEKKKAKKALEE